MPSFFVYRADDRRKAYPHNWRFVQECGSYDDAVRVALELCKCKPVDVYTEPGGELPAAFFAPRTGRRWSAMISTTDIHASEGAS